MARRLFTLLATAIFVINSVQAAPVQRRGRLQRRGSFKGQATFFSPGLGACGGYNSADDLICALNKPQFDDGGNPNNNPLCGKSITIKGPKGSVTVTVTDECPECNLGDLDLSPAAFNQIADPNDGRVEITWTMVFDALFSGKPELADHVTLDDGSDPLDHPKGYAGEVLGNN